MEIPVAGSTSLAEVEFLLPWQENEQHAHDDTTVTAIDKLRPRSSIDIPSMRALWWRSQMSVHGTVVVPWTEASCQRANWCIAICPGGKGAALAALTDREAARPVSASALHELTQL